MGLAAGVFISFLWGNLQLPKALAAGQPAKAEHDGVHDFDFGVGTWRTQIKHLQKPLTGSKAWADWSGVVTTRKVWSGRANLEELEIDTPSGHVEGLTLRLYNPESHQWNLSWASSSGGTLGQPGVGEFKNSRGEFFDQESYRGRSILVRQVYSDITPNSYHFEQAFSDDGGKTWEPNWEANLTRLREATPAAQDGAGEDIQHDFDFNFGTWKTHVSRLEHPLAGATAWVNYDGTSNVAKVWNGRASLFELEVDGPAGHIEGVGLRLYNPQSHQWSLNWANSRDGTMGQPMVGEFKNGRGEFFDAELFNGKNILARNGFSDITANSSRFEQAFSIDGGRNWETNWVMTFERVNNAPQQTQRENR